MPRRIRPCARVLECFAPIGASGGLIRGIAARLLQHGSSTRGEDEGKQADAVRGGRECLASTLERPVSACRQIVKKRGKQSRSSRLECSLL